MQRDDIYEYSLDTHHDEEHGKKIRKKIYFVLFLLSAVTIIEVGLGMMFSRDPGMKEILKVTFILMTLVKAGYIVMVFMHLGDEKKNFRYTVLLPFIILIGYLIAIALAEASYSSHHRPTGEKLIEASGPGMGGGDHAEEHGESEGGHH